MKRHSCQTFSAKVLAVLGLIVVFITQGAGLAVGETTDNRLRGDFQRLKQQFEDEIKKTSDPKITSCLAVETSALAWMLAAANLSATTEDSLLRLNKANEFEKNRSKAENWDTRNLSALEFYYETMTELITLMSTKTGQSSLISELDQVVATTEEQFAALEGKEDVLPEKRVILSGALVSLMSVLAKTVGGGSMEQPAQRILSNVVTKADHISKRPDIHYRAKLSLLYANNIQGLTAFIFLLGQNAGPPLSSDLAVLHSNLNQYGSGLNLPDVMSLTWVAQAQASVPLGYWLSTNY